ncbi:sensor histidine kinase [Microbacterium suwonense]|uniref:histidine kinase n=1 Tax=Microbacterium suwonense TaxID=683047 RepID=A0ABM8FY69_9MICO|nr:HAMP domain-containing sensor histidine kinase [Microbacterium suwonense]BDZ40604.1 hypothetical protein GCM10025863_32180 [Microbacterium suwonense]
MTSLSADGGALLVPDDSTAEELALRAQEELIASVSHELRTPLTAIIGYLDLTLAHDEMSERARRSIGIAQRNATRMLEIVSDLLEASAVSSTGGASAIAPEDIDLSEIVMAAVESAGHQADERAIAVDTAGVRVLRAWADPHRIRQVLDNLISNAVKYGRDGDTVWVATAQEQGSAVITVRDDGPGVPEDEVPHLFERFFRSALASGSTTHGSGLGLSISRDIVRAHGGELTATSTLGEGSTFAVRLPPKAG